MDILKSKEIGLLTKVGDLAREMKFQVYIVGGWVRDQLINRPSKDIDFLALGDGLEFAEKLGEKLGGVKVSLFKTYGTASIHYNSYELEFVGARKESYAKDSRNPIVEAGSFEDDLNRRDFTINTLAISLNKDDFGQIIDRFNGIEDLKNKIKNTKIRS